MIKIRLSRGGARNNPVYRIVVIDESRKKNGEALNILGYWMPKKTTTIDKKRLNEWVKKGAQVSKAVQELL